MEAKLATLSSAQKRKVIAKTKLLYVRENGDYIIWDSYETNLKAFGIERKDVPTLINMFISAVREKEHILLETSRYGKNDIKAIAGMVVNNTESDVAFMLEIKEYISTQQNLYTKLNFYNLNGADKKHGISLFFSEALTYIKMLNLWENCTFDCQALKLKTLIAPEDDNFF